MLPVYEVCYESKALEALCVERVAEKAKGMRVTFAFYSSWYLFAHGSHQQCPVCSQCRAPPSLQSHCARVNSSCLGQLEWKLCWGGENPLLSLHGFTGWNSAGERGPWRWGRINGIMEEKRRECRWLTPALAGAKQDT